jgi:large subunit ribosomal protein L25
MSTTLYVKPRRGEKRSELKNLRNNHIVPGIIYGKDVLKKVQVDEAQLLQTLRNHSNELITVESDGDKHQVLIAEIQKEPLKNKLLHVDFRQVDMNVAVSVEIPITLTGESKGVKSGGVIQQQTQTVTIRCLPNEIPSSFELNISELDIGDQVKLEEVVDTTKYDVQSDPKETILSILPPRMNPVEDKIEADTFVADDGDKHIFVEETE